MSVRPEWDAACPDLHTYPHEAGRLASRTGARLEDSRLAALWHVGCLASGDGETTARMGVSHCRGHALCMDYILLLEDEAPLRHALARSLREALGVEVAECATLADAVRALELRSPSLIVCDLDLPDGTGLDLLPELAVRGLRLPIVIISAHLGRFGAELPSSPNIDILPKPFEAEQLLELSRRRLTPTSPQHPAFAVADYLQLAGMARRSVHLSVHRGEERLGEIVVQDGEPRWAIDQHGEGEAAFRRLALLQRAEVICQTLSAPVSQSNLSGSLEHMLIDAARHADELKRQGTRGLEAPAATPPSKAPPPPPRRSAGSGELPAQPGPSASAGPPPPPLRGKPPIPPRPSEARMRAAEPVAGSAQPLAPAPSAPAQEKTVTLSKPKPSLSNLSTIDPSLKAGARADRAGSVVETAGEIDAESACAVSTMAARDIAEAAAEVGFGKPLAWHISIGDSTWYVAHAKDELIVSQGGLNKNPGGTLKKLAKAYGA